MDFALTDQQQQIRDEVLKLCAPLRRRLLAGARPDRDLPGRVLRRHGGGQLARHRHAGGVRRRRSRHHRGGHPDAGGRRIRRLHVGRLGHPPQHLRPQPGGGVRHRGAEAAHAAAASSRATTRRASASPSRTPASTPRRSPRAPSAVATATSSTAPRSGPRPRRSRTRSCCWRAPRRSIRSSATAMADAVLHRRSTARMPRCG